VGAKERTQKGDAGDRCDVWFIRFVPFRVDAINKIMECNRSAQFLLLLY